MSKKIFSFIAFRGDTFNGVCGPAPEDILSDFLLDMALAGNTIKPVYSREEYNAELAKLKT